MTCSMTTTFKKITSLENLKVNDSHGSLLELVTRQTLNFKHGIYKTLDLRDDNFTNIQYISEYLLIFY
jgi:hypothetical protein